MTRVLPVVLSLALTIYALVDCIQTDESKVRNLPKLLWLLLILLFPVVGPIAWLIAGRAAAPWPPRAPRGPSGPPRGPDDDPDFLRRL